MIAFCLVVSQWIYLLKKFKYSSIVIEAEEITFFDKDFRMSFLNSEIKKIDVYSEIMCITQLGYSYSLTIGKNNNKLTIYDNSKKMLQYLKSTNTKVTENKVYFSAFRAKYSK